MNLVCRPCSDGVHGTPPGQQRHEGLHLDRFRQIVVHAGRQAALTVSHHRVRRQRRHLHPRVEDSAGGIPQEPGGLKAIHLGHLTVHEDQVIGTLTECGEGFDAIARHVRPVPDFFEHHADHPLVDGIVFHHQHPNVWGRDS